MQIPAPDELDHIAVRHRTSPGDPLVCFQKIPPPAAIPNQEFSIDEFVPCRFIESQQFVQLLCVGCPVRQKPDPYRRIDQNHQVV